jgi:enoyl-CoA hydratase/carnithine racemase
VADTVTFSADAAGVGFVRLRKPPHNFVDADDLAALKDALVTVAGSGARAIVLTTEGKNFCAGAVLTSSGDSASGIRDAYKVVPDLFAVPIPVVAAVQGKAVGAGLGLALSADFRVGTQRTAFSAPFSLLGFHPGFGLTATLPRLVGPQRAARMMYTGEPVVGDQALAWGLCDEIATEEELSEAARQFALRIASAAPLAVRSIRQTLRAGAAQQVRNVLEGELRQQERLMRTKDYAEGVAAAAERRVPRFTGE